MHIPETGITVIRCSEKHTGGERWVQTPLETRPDSHIPACFIHPFSPFSHLGTATTTVRTPRSLGPGAGVTGYSSLSCINGNYRLSTLLFTVMHRGEPYIGDLPGLLTVLAGLFQESRVNFRSGKPSYPLYMPRVEPKGAETVRKVLQRVDNVRHPSE